MNIILYFNKKLYFVKFLHNLNVIKYFFFVMTIIINLNIKIILFIKTKIIIILVYVK